MGLSAGQKGPNYQLISQFKCFKFPSSEFSSGPSLPSTYAGQLEFKLAPARSQVATGQH
jgi:hypothetical protein